MAASVLLMIVLSNDGDTNWFEGATLLAAYTIMGYSVLLAVSDCIRAFVVRVFFCGCGKWGAKRGKFSPPRINGAF